MMKFVIYFFTLIITLGLINSKPTDKTSVHAIDPQKVPIDQAFRKAELTLNRYFYQMDSDIDHLVHAILHLLMNNPTLFPYIPQRAMEITFKNLASKLTPSELDTLTKPMLLTLEENYQNQSAKAEAVHLTNDIKDEIEDALDQFLDETVEHE